MNQVSAEERLASMEEAFERVLFKVSKVDRQLEEALQFSTFVGDCELQDPKEIREWIIGIHGDLSDAIKLANDELG